MWARGRKNECMIWQLKIRTKSQKTLMTNSSALFMHHRCIALQALHKMETSLSLHDSLPLLYLDSVFRSRHLTFFWCHAQKLPANSVWLSRQALPPWPPHTHTPHSAFWCLNWLLNQVFPHHCSKCPIHSRTPIAYLRLCKLTPWPQ